MLKVENRKVTGEVARATYRANVKRNILIIFAIMLTTLLIAVVIAVGTSYWEAVSQRQIRMEGMDYDIALTEPRDDQVKEIRSMENVRYAGVAVKCAIVEKYEDRTLDKTKLYWLDETCWEKQTVPALEKYEGRYPQAESEIMMSTAALKAMGIEKPHTGMELPMAYFTLAEGSEGALLHGNFTLSGWYTDYSGSMRGYVSRDFFETTGAKQTDFTQGSLKITLENPLYSEADIIRMQNEIDMDNRQIIEADYDTVSSFCKTVACLALLLLMIFASGYLFIYNALYISISKDIRYYGQLKTIGMITGQLKRIVVFQALWNAAAGIPVGIIAAAVLSKAVIPALLHAVNPELSTNSSGPMIIWALAAAAVFAFLTNMTGCRKPAKMAGECSPVEAMKYVPGSSASARRRRGRESGSVPSMAFHNVFRDRKQAAVIFASFIIAISVFLVVNEVIRENDARLILNETSTCDISFRNETTLDDDRRQLITKEKISEVEAIAGVKEVRKVTSAEMVVPYQEQVYGRYYRELYKSRYSPGNYENDMEAYRADPYDGSFTARFISVDKAGFDVLNESLGGVLDWSDFRDGKVAAAAKTFTEGDDGIPGKTVRFSLPESKSPEQEHAITIAAVGDIYSNPAYFAGGYTPDLIVSEKYASELMGDKLFTELIEVEYDEPFSAATEKKVKAVFADDKQISCESKLDRYSEMKTSENQIKVLGGSLGAVIALLAVLNYINMMAASVQNRSQELATLESIGMTTKQIRKMLRLEGLWYAAVSSVVSLAVGLPMSYIVFRGMNAYRISFSVPWVMDLVLLAIIFLICVTAPVVVYSRTQRGSVIERLRR